MSFLKSVKRKAGLLHYRQKRTGQQREQLMQVYNIQLNNLKQNKFPSSNIMFVSNDDIYPANK